MGGRYVAANTQIIIRSNIIISDNAPVVEIMSESKAVKKKLEEKCLE